MMKKNNLSANILVVLASLALLFLLFLRFRLAVARYFDIDEFAYLHWSYNLSLGERPYRDFLFLLPPSFLYFLQPLFIFLGRSVQVLIAARLMIFIVFILMCLMLVFIGKSLRNLKTGIFSAVIFAFLPIPYDKMLEIRPDLPAVLFALFGLYLFMLTVEKHVKRWSFISGFALSLSLTFIPKTVFFLLPAIFAMWFMGYRAAAKDELRQVWQTIIFPFIAGFFIPAVVTFLIVASYGDLRMAFYSMTRLASDIHRTLGSKFYMLPNLFFYPNDTYYGLAGTNNLPYILNLVVYITASLWAIKSFFSARNLRELLFAAVFFINLLAFVKFYPLKHAQYLIALAPFIAFYFADIILTIFSLLFRVKKSSRALSLNFSFASAGRIFAEAINFVLIITVLLLIIFADYQMYEKKKQWNNRVVIEKIIRTLKTVPAEERVFDLTGGSIFYRHGYYFCCLSYGQYEEVLRFPVPDLKRVFEDNKTKYVYTDFFDRLDVLPFLQARYIKENFTPYFPDGSLLIKK